MIAAFSGTWHRVRSGELGVLPVVGLLALVWLVFQAINPAFLSSDNLVNLTQQSAATGVIALGVVVLLHVGQLDLSIGAVSGLAAAITAVTSVQWGWSQGVSVLVALGVGLAVGLVYGMVHTRLGVPGFVFTLAGLLLVTGLQLRVLGPTGSINLPFETPLVYLSQRAFLAPAASWTLVALIAAGYVAARLVERSRRLRVDLPAESLGALAARCAVLVALLVGGVAYLGTNRGVGVAFAVFVALVAAVDFALRRTRWGRSVRAVGGDADAARKAGVPVRRVFVSAFVVSSTMAALGGVLATGRLAAANQGTGEVELVLTAIAAAVIGGTSLFGGRGSAWSALLGVLVVQSVSTGVLLAGGDYSMRLVVTGLVFTVAIWLDAVARRARRG
ncbi:MAG: sugar ABC transporter permease [Actinomycetales bacterium]|nr:sugar ABC transporter permease [Actinomycetales bacterium]